MDCKSVQDDIQQSIWSILANQAETRQKIEQIYKHFCFDVDGRNKISKDGGAGIAGFSDELPLLVGGLVKLRYLADLLNLTEVLERECRTFRDDADKTVRV